MDTKKDSHREWINCLLNSAYVEGRQSGWYWVDFGEGWECAEWADREGAWLQGGMYIIEEPEHMATYIPYPEDE